MLKYRYLRLKKYNNSRIITKSDLHVLLETLFKGVLETKEVENENIKIDVFAPHFSEPIFSILPNTDNKVVLKVHFAKPRRLFNSKIWVLIKEKASFKDIKHCVQSSTIFSNQIIEPMIKFLGKIARNFTVYLAFDTNVYAVLKNISIMERIEKVGLKNVTYVALRPVKAELITRNPPIFAHYYLKELQRNWKIKWNVIEKFKGAPFLVSRKWILAYSAYNYTLNNRNTIEIGDFYKGDNEIISTLRKLKRKKSNAKIILATFDKRMPEDTYFERFILHYPSRYQLMAPIKTTFENIVDLLHITTIIFQTIALEIKEPQISITLTKLWENHKMIMDLKKDKILVENKKGQLRERN